MQVSYDTSISCIYYFENYLREISCKAIRYPRKIARLVKYRKISILLFAISFKSIVLFEVSHLYDYSSASSPILRYLGT